MKQTTNIQRSISYLVKIFKALNEEYFDGALPMPIITIQSTPKAYGHFTPWDAYRIKDEKGEMHGAVEVNIGAGTLDRSIESVVSTLQHELIHYYCYLNNIKDTSRCGQYHNKKFRDEAEARGLHIEYDSRIGWSITEPTEELIDFIISCGFEDIQIGRNEWTSFVGAGGSKAGSGGAVAPKPKKSNSRKMICPCCGNIARVTKPTNLICGDCMEHMIEV